MEVLGAVGSGVTLALLFKYTFEALDIIHLYQTQDTDFNKIQLQFKLEKCRLYNWGAEMGLTDSSRRSLLEEWHSEALVSECLERLLRLLIDAENIREKYGCGEVPPGIALSIDRAPRSSIRIAEAFDNFRIQTPKLWKTGPAALKKSKWVVRDRKKFLLLIGEVRGLVDSLQDITAELSTAAKLEELLRVRIDRIPDVDTLCQIATAWKESHPRVASAASTQAECLSMSSGRRRDISDWQTLVDNDVSDNYMAVTELEDPTVTELKHSMIRMKEEIASLKKMKDEDAESTGAVIRVVGELQGDTKLQARLIVVIAVTTLALMPVTFFATFAGLDFGPGSWLVPDQMKAARVSSIVVVGTFAWAAYHLRPSQNTKSTAGRRMKDRDVIKLITVVVIFFLPATIISVSSVLCTALGFFLFLLSAM